MNETTKHTPTPWKTHECGTADHVGNFQEFIFIEAGDEHIASIYDVQKNRKTATESDYYISPKNAANAAHIVKCVNAHDALVTALRDVKKRIEASEYWWMGSPDRGGFDVDMIDAALANADKPDHA